MKNSRILIFAILVFPISILAQNKLTNYVNPFLGTAPLQDSIDVGYTPPKDWRVWAGLTYPGSSVPNAMVQLSPITNFHSGAGYQYEDTVIYAFTHTNKGHWNLCHIPILPVTGDIDPENFGYAFNHEDESAEPGYYQVLLNRYNINAELTSSLRCGFHKYSFPKNEDKKVIVNLAVSNERVSDWEIKQEGTNVFKGYQQTGGKVFFYALANQSITEIKTINVRKGEISVLHFEDSAEELEIKIGLSFVSEENAKENLEKEIKEKSFAQVRTEASNTWEELLSKIQVRGGTQKQKGLFYSSLYRSFLWPALRSDINGEFTDESGKVVKKTSGIIPSLPCGIHTETNLCY